MALKFMVSGSQGDEYEIRAAKKGTEMWISCTCPAGQFGTYCKHRMALLNGQVDALLSGNEKDVEKLAKILRGTTLEKLMDERFALEKEIAKLNGRNRSVKKKIASYMPPTG